MPIYEYQCTQCGKTSEFLQKISDEPIQICPHCQTSALSRKVSLTSFQLKGSGWYVTDFKDKKPTTDKDKDKDKDNKNTEGSKEASNSQSREKPTETSKTSSGTQSTKDSS